MTDLSTATTPTHVGHSQLANAIRFLSLDAVEAANSGHPGLPMGMADIATVLWGKFLKFDPARPDWPDRDRFVLSAGHGSMLLYAVNWLTGYKRVGLDELKRFRQLHSLTPGHPEHDVLAGVETTTGPLGQGIATAVGMALAERILNARFGDELVDHRTWVIASDGDLMEGVSHEACSIAGHLGLKRLIVLYDDNGISIDGPTSLSFSDDTANRFRSYGWNVATVDGHDPEEIENALASAMNADKPTLIACRTIIGYGSPNRAGTSEAHSNAFGAAELAATREKLDWPHGPFVIPDQIVDAWRSFGVRGRDASAAWSKQHEQHRQRAAFDQAIAGDVRGLDALIQQYKTKVASEKPKIATRQASGQVLELLSPSMPEMIGGSADLTPSNNTRVKNSGAIEAGNFNGRYVHWGVREHGMAAAMNGMALHGGVIPYGGTFLSFADYCRPAIRLAALMKQRSIFVMTHDSIGLGEDGPTHQPVEHIASLRAMPNLLVLRPCDAVETAEAWQLALTRTDGPSLLALTRQAVPHARTDAGAENLTARGAYKLAAATADERVTLLATGSEIGIALDAKRELENAGIGTSVVSMPCWSLFEKQSEAYRRSLLPANTLKVAIEAGVRMGWDRWIGPDGIFIGMEGFGESAPYAQLYERFGITTAAVTGAVRARL
ncbi:transketolase [Roseiterribacter gracilis]|uniref:Transketolase n=1 Tax=Roseiterribacter gracilis TaxID=2812848 RepID=A0A8S8XG11_9PROT|nr:transketolase [Rhodospirillales bacterium TMPK1]